jgi:hypothetical protein
MDGPLRQGVLRHPGPGDLMSTLLTLVQTLRTCPTHKTSVQPELVSTVWNGLIRMETTAKPALAVMAALVIEDYRFAGLLTAMENQQLRALVQLALDRYEQQTNPPNKFGKLLAGNLTKI